EYILSDRHRIGGLLKLAGIIRIVDTPQSGRRQRYLKREIDWNQLATLVMEPIKGFREAYDWDSQAPQVSQLIGDLASVLDTYGLQLLYFQPSGDLLAFINAGATGA